MKGNAMVKAIEEFHNSLEGINYYNEDEVKSLVSKTALKFEVEVSKFLPCCHALVEMKNETPSYDARGHRIWSEHEKEFVVLFVGQFGEEGGVYTSISQAAKLIGRSDGAVNHVYYGEKKSKDINKLKERRWTLSQHLYDPNAAKMKEGISDIVWMEGVKEKSPEDLMEGNLVALMNGNIEEIKSLFMEILKSRSEDRKTIENLENKLEEREVENERLQTTLLSEKKNVQELEAKLGEVQEEIAKFTSNFQKMSGFAGSIRKLLSEAQKFLDTKNEAAKGLEVMINKFGGVVQVRQ